MKDAVIDKAQSKVTHALRRKMTAIERNLASENTLRSHTDTKPVGALKLG